MAIFGTDSLFDAFNEEHQKDEVINGDNNESLSSNEIDHEELTKQKEENDFLKSENEKLRRALRMLTRPPGINVKDVSQDGPIFHILMFNNAYARKHQDDITNFVEDLISYPMSPDDDFSAVGNLQKTAFEYIENNLRRKHIAPAEAYRVFSSLQMYKEFYLDMIGQPLEIKNSNVNRRKIPEYNRTISGIMTNDPDEPILTEQKKIGRICFNCGGEGHQLKDCEKPKNFREINRRRGEFNVKFDSPMRSNARYHKDEDNDESFDDLKPGVLSKEVKTALGISDDDIAPYIYQMRTMGYPPGHLEAAKVVTSGLELYEEKNNKKKNPKLTQNEYVPIDLDKLIAFPGFNIPPLPGQNDIHEQLGALAFDENQSLDSMKKYFNHKNMLRRQRHENMKEVIERKRRKIQEQEQPDDDLNVVDMDMGEDDDATQPKSPIDVEDGEIDDDGHVHIIEDPASPDADEDAEIDVELGDLSEEELQIKMALIQKQLLATAEENKDSNNDSVVDLTNQSSPDVEIVGSDHQEEDVIVVNDDSSENNSDKDLRTKMVDSKPNVERKNSSDTDWRLHNEQNETKDTDWRAERMSVEINQNESSEINNSSPESNDTDWRRESPHSPVEVVSISDKNIQEKDSKKIKIESQNSNNVAKNSNVEEYKTDKNQFAQNVGNDILVNGEVDTSSSLAVENDTNSISVETNLNSNSVSKSPKDNENTSNSENHIKLLDKKLENSSTNEAETRSLPTRNKFAVGITDFNQLYTNETKSQGVYLRIRNILKK